VRNLVGGDVAVLLCLLCVIVIQFSDQFPCLAAVSGHVQIFNWRVVEMKLITSSPAAMVCYRRDNFHKGACIRYKYGGWMLLSQECSSYSNL